MTLQPLVERRDPQPYHCIRGTAESEESFRGAVAAAFPELFGWLAAQRIEPCGPPFIRYLDVSPDGEPREFEVSVPVDASGPGDERVRADALPGGSYATVLHVGPYTSDAAPDLNDARAALLEWAQRERIEWDSWELEHGTAFRACVERYLTGYGTWISRQEKSTRLRRTGLLSSARKSSTALRAPSNSP